MHCTPNASGNFDTLYVSVTRVLIAFGSAAGVTEI